MSWAVTDGLRNNRHGNDESNKKEDGLTNHFERGERKGTVVGVRVNVARKEMSKRCI